MSHQVLRAIEPHLSMERVFAQWHKIAEDLAEAPRKRKPQISRYF